MIDIPRRLTDDEEARLLAIAAPALLTMLRKREAACRSRIYGEFRQGQLNLHPAVAEWSAYVDMIRDIETKLTERDSQKGPT